MRILMIGGTVFLGRHIVESALERGHDVTIFTRGQHNPDLFPQAEHLRGDRDGGLQPLEGRNWDAVIDTCGYFPRVVGASAQLLSDAVDRYVFISSLSVHADMSRAGVDESGPVATIEDESVEEITGETYGALKALCEQAAEKALPGRTLVIRPGLIVGPHDPTDRFTYWPHRVAMGGEVLAPDGSDWVTQFIDVRDLAHWTVKVVEERATGVFSATGPDEPLRFGSLLDSCLEVSGSDATFTWVPGAFLLEREVQPWMDLPLWLPDSPEYYGFSRFDVGKAVSAGLTFRPVDDTVRDTLAWDATRPPDHEWRAGISLEKERELLDLWHQSASGS